MSQEAYRHDEVYNTEKLPELINKYDEEMKVYLKEIHREQEVDWSSQTMGPYQYVYFPEVTLL